MTSAAAQGYPIGSMLRLAAQDSPVVIFIPTFNYIQIKEQSAEIPRERAVTSACCHNNSKLTWHTGGVSYGKPFTPCPYFS